MSKENWQVLIETRLHQQQDHTKPNAIDDKLIIERNLAFIERSGFKEVLEYIVSQANFVPDYTSVFLRTRLNQISGRESTTYSLRQDDDLFVITDAEAKVPVLAVGLTSYTEDDYPFGMFYFVRKSQKHSGSESLLFSNGFCISIEDFTRGLLNILLLPDEQLQTELTGSNQTDVPGTVYRKFGKIFSA